MPAIFAKKIYKTHSVMVIVICSDHRFLWPESYKGVDHPLTPDKPMLKKINIIVIMLGYNNNSKGKIWKQSIENRLTHMDSLKIDWPGLDWNDDWIRINLKKTFFNSYFEED